MTAELEARITAANAVLADFHDADQLDGARAVYWAYRLAHVLGQLLDGLAAEPAR